MVLNLMDRAGETYEELEPRSRDLAERLKSDFPEYFEGEEIRMHPDIGARIRESELEIPQQVLVREYSGLFSANSVLPEAATAFGEYYESQKYGKNYSFNNFMLLWDIEQGEFASGDEDLGTYSPLVIWLVNHLERRRELQNYFYADETTFIPESDEFRKMGLISVLANNPDLIQDAFLGSLDGNLGDRSRDIATDRLLANEVAWAFVDAYGDHKKSAQYRKGLGNFLQKFDIENGKYLRKTGVAQYANLYSRLVRAHGNLWRQKFVELVDDPAKSRVDLLNRDLGKKGVIEEDKIRLIERLAQEDLFKYLHLLSDEGADAGDILLAARIGSLTGEERKALTEITGKGDVSLGNYLGTCRVKFPDSAVQYDAKRCLGELCRVMENNVLQDEILSSILFSKMRRQYLGQYASDPVGTLSELEREVETEDNDVRKILLERTLAHFNLRKEVKNVKGVRKDIVVVS